MLVIEVKQLAREFQDLLQTSKPLVEITVTYHEKGLVGSAVFGGR